MLSVSLIASLLSACSNGNENVSKSEGDNPTSMPAEPRATASSSLPERLQNIGFQAENWPIVTEKVSVSVFGGTHPLLGAQEDWENNKMLNRLEEKTNIDLELSKVINLGTGWKEQMNLAFASGELPDFFFKSMFTKLEEMNYGKQGLLIPLEDLIAEYAPHLSSLMEEYPEIRKSITTPDGHIYTFPELNVDPISRVTANLNINHVWLENVGMKVPTTLDELYEVLVAFKTKDPNGNGKADEIPLSLSEMPNILSLMRLFGYMYGDDGMFLDPDKNQILFVPSTPEFKQYLEYFNRLYKEGLLDSESFTQKPDQITSKNGGEVTTVGAFLTNSPVLLAPGLSAKAKSDDLTIDENQRKSDYTFIVLTAPNGKKYAAGGSVVSTGRAAITKKAENPEIIVRWLDYFYSKEGGEEMWAGLKDEDYKIENDRIVFLKSDGSVATGAEAGDVRKYATLQPGGRIPHLVPETIINLLDFDLKKLKEPLAPYAQPALPSFFFAPEDLKRISAMSADIGPYIEQFAAKAITGQINLDAEWDQFQSTLKRMGSDDLLMQYQKAYEIFDSN